MNHLTLNNLVLALVSYTATAKYNPPKHLRATALISTSHNTSALQCWEFEPAFTISTSAGTSGAANLPLAQLSNASYTVIPPHFDGGLHNAPSAQLVVFLSGAANVSIPHTKTSVYIEGGKDGLLVAVDTKGMGHVTKYPTGEETRTLQIPFALDKHGEAEIPKHTIRRKNGPCRGEEELLNQ